MSPLARIRLVLPLLALLLVPSVALAAWPTDPRVNVPLCTAAGNQWFPSMCEDGSGGMIVVWDDQRNQPTGYDTYYAQRVTSSGEVAWAPTGICLGLGGVVPPIFWDGSAVLLSLGATVQRFLPDGSRLWGENGAGVVADSSWIHGESVVSDGRAGAIVVLVKTNYGEQNHDIRLQRIDAAGARAWGDEGIAVAATSVDEFYSRLISDGNGGAIVIWTVQRPNDAQAYVQHVSSEGELLWGSGVPFCTVPAPQNVPFLDPDGRGGACGLWTESRFGSLDVHAQKVSAVGTLPWGAEGVPVCTAPDSQRVPLRPGLVSDGAGGLITAWEDRRSGGWDIYAQHIDSTGAAAWTADGIPVCTEPDRQRNANVLADGSGGAYVSWRDHRDGIVEGMYAQHLDANGTKLWFASGMPACVASGNRVNQDMVRDDHGGVIMAWQDLRSGTGDMYAQRLNWQGTTGRPEPAITDVRDVPGDQGGAVRVEWLASEWDTLTIAMQPAASPPAYDVQEWLDGGWSLLATIPVIGAESYACEVPTRADSVSGDTHWNTYRVTAHPFDPTIEYPSPSASGYSVDNLAPAMPAPFAATFAYGTARLHWGANYESDLAAYRLHRGATPDFVPGPENLLAQIPDTGYVDVVGERLYYRLGAVDVHGNAGPFAFAEPQDLADVGPSAPLRLAVRAAPNPSPRLVRFRVALPVASALRLRVSDPAGRLVWSSDRGRLPAGEHEVAWSTRALPAGIYWVEARTDRGSVTSRLVLTR